MRCAMAVSRQIITYLFPDPSNRQTNSLVTSTNCLSVTIQLKSIEFFCPSAVIEKWVDCRQTNSLVSSTNELSVRHNSMHRNEEMKTEDRQTIRRPRGTLTSRSTNTHSPQTTPTNNTISLADHDHEDNISNRSRRGRRAFPSKQQSRHHSYQCLLYITLFTYEYCAEAATGCIVIIVMDRRCRRLHRHHPLRRGQGVWRQTNIYAETKILD